MGRDRKSSCLNWLTPEVFCTLLDSYREGNTKALAELIKRMMPIIHKRAWILSCFAERVDLVQQGVLIFLENLPKIRTDKGSAPILFSAGYIMAGLKSYCLIGSAVSRPLKFDKRHQLIPAARVTTLGDLDWIYSFDFVSQIPPMAEISQQARCTECKSWMKEGKCTKCEKYLAPPVVNHL